LKTEILTKAIINRNRIKFYYSTQQLVIDPYIISTDVKGKKIIYGKLNESDTVLKFEFNKIYNIKVLENENFAPRLNNAGRFN
jgi:hypothetical protein